ncbi:MAG TPA: GNAT family N-acetyltransferase [Candidatus Binataceae bacterium]|nr:GNAT family N-acetyltransferase [Candidatus Binataceae bacterium]
MEVRDASVDDLPGILAIFNEVIANSTAIWFDTLENLEGRRQWFEARHARGFPILVAVEAGDMLGYSTFGDFRAWHGYRHTVEHSIYVRADSRRAGIGRILLSALIERATASRAHVMVGAIEASNHASLALHMGLGFKEVARMPEVGCKFGRWLDLVLVQRLLDSRKTP